MNAWKFSTVTVRCSEFSVIQRSLRCFIHIKEKVIRKGRAEASQPGNDQVVSKVIITFFRACLSHEDCEIHTHTRTHTHRHKVPSCLLFFLWAWVDALNHGTTHRPCTSTLSNTLNHKTTLKTGCTWTCEEFLYKYNWLSVPVFKISVPVSATVFVGVWKRMFSLLNAEKPASSDADISCFAAHLTFIQKNRRKQAGYQSQSVSNRGSMFMEEEHCEATPRPKPWPWPWVWPWR